MENTGMSQAIGPFGPAGAKLPLGATIGLSYSTYFRNFVDVLRTSWLWLLLVAPLGGIVGWMQAVWFAEAVANMKQRVPPQLPPKSFQMIALGGLDNLLVLVAGVSIAVAWHRRIILDERPRFSGNNVVTESFWRYVWVGVLIFLMVGIPVLAVFLPTFYFLSFGVTGKPPAQPVSALALLLFATLFVVYLAAIAVFLRLTLLFPARAAGDVGLRFRQAWDRTRGNTWRLLWGIVACMLPAALLMQIVLLFVIGFPGPETFTDPSFAGRFAALGAVTIICYLLILPIGIGFLSHAYRHFFRPA
jgi:hypothetical protein